jgi:general secretion pathway protein B
MSYILEALKKADRDRNLAKVPTLTTVQLPVHVAGRRTAFWAVAIVLVAGGLTWFLRPVPPRDPVAPIAPTPPVEVPVESLTLDRVPAPPVSATAPQPNLVKPAPTAPPVRSRPVRTETQESSKATPFPAEPDATTPTPAAPIPALPAARLESLPRTERDQAPSRPVPLAPPPEPPAEPTLREASGNLTLDVFVYTDLEADRMVVISGRRYVKGQLVDGRYLLEDITPEGAVLSYRGERTLLRP